MSERPPFPLLREPGWTMLRQRIEALGVRDRRMRHAGDLLLRPLRLLQSLGADTPGALGTDVLAAERLRHLLFLATPWSSLVDEADKLLLKGSNGDPAQPPEAGILDLSLLVVVGLAAARVAPSPKLAHLFLQTVHGLALSATPAEMLGRLGPYGHEGPALIEVVNLMVLPDAARLTDNRLFLPRFVLDPVERARWVCLQRFFRHGLDPLVDDDWREWALRLGAFEIDSVQPRDAAPGATLTLTGRFPVVPNEDWPEGARVLFFSPESPTLEAKVDSFDGSAITVVVPTGSAPGWIGIDDVTDVERQNRARARIRERVATLSGGTILARDGCLDRPVPIETWLADVTAPVSSPRTAHNRYVGPAEPSSEPSPEPGRHRTVVVFRPVVLEPDPSRVSGDDVQRVARGVLRAQGWELVFRELPWVPDGLAVLSSPLRSPDDPRVRTLLELAARSALLTPGLEDALFVVLVPGDAGLAVHAPAEAASAVGIATLAGLARVLKKAFPSRPSQEPREITSRLRVSARWLATGGVTLDAVCEDAARAAGPGAPFETGLHAVAFDAAHRELFRSPVASFRKARPAPIGLLVPISAEVAVVELQANAETLQRIVRPRERPELGDVRLDKTTLSWHYRHREGARPRLSVEVGRDGLWTRFLPLDACHDEAAIPLQRLGGGVDGLRLVASDGWNVSHREVGSLVADGPAVVARRVNAGEWWADVADTWTVRWRFGSRTSSRRVLRLDGPARGPLRLLARNPATDIVRSDERPLGGESCE